MTSSGRETHTALRHVLSVKRPNSRCSAAPLADETDSTKTGRVSLATPLYVFLASPELSLGVAPAVVDSGVAPATVLLLDDDEDDGSIPSRGDLSEYTTLTVFEPQSRQ